ncbi:MAG: HEAT repeat domain-containing protein [Cyanobium sp. ELA507]
MSSLPMIDPFASLTPLIEAVEQADTATALLVATARLASQLAGGDPPAPAAIAALVQVLGFNNPGAAVAAVDGLIACGEAAVAPLLDNLDAHNYGARAWAVRALAGIGDVRGLELLEQALGGDIGPSVRRAAARGLGQLRCGALPDQERRDVLERALTALEAAAADDEWVVRYAVVVGLESLALDFAPETGGSKGEIWERALRTLTLLSQHDQDTTVVPLRANQALGRLGPAA